VLLAALTVALLLCAILAVPVWYAAPRVRSVVLQQVIVEVEEPAPRRRGGRRFDEGSRYINDPLIIAKRR
jgi:hypothetical protein